MKASTQSYIAKHTEVKKMGEQLYIAFENRHALVNLDKRLPIEMRLQQAAQTAASRMFTEDMLGAILFLRFQGEILDE